MTLPGIALTPPARERTAADKLPKTGPKFNLL
jgi:hypothetical protein